MRSVSGRAWWIALLVLCALFGAADAGAQQKGEGRTIGERIGKIQRMRLIGKIDRSYRLPGEKLPGEGKPGTSISTAGGRITGTITGIDDIPAVEPYLLAYPADDTTNDGIAVYAQIYSNGAYTVEDLGPGNYLLVASADGYVTQYYDRAAEALDAKPIHVVANGTVTKIDFPMERRWAGTGAISGTVRSESTGRGIPRAEVLISRNDGTFEFARVTTAANGTYRMSALAAGSYRVEVWAENHAPEIYDNTYYPDSATAVIVADSTETDGIDFVLSAGGMISGRVVDGEGNPISEAFIEALMIAGDDSTFRWSMDGSAMTDANGNYSIGGLAAGTYQVMAMAHTGLFIVAEYYENASQPDSATPVPVSLNAITDSIDFMLESAAANGVIEGTIVDANGDPIPGAIVTIQSTDQTDPFGFGIWTSTMTNSTGAYSITELPDGEYLVSASAQSGMQYVEEWWQDAEFYDEATPVVLTDGASDPASIDFQLDFEIGTSAIGGTVTLADGTPAINVGVELIAIDPTNGYDLYSLYSYTDQNGSYGFPALPAGSYMLHTSHWAENAFDEEWYRGVSTRDSALTLTLGREDIRTGVDFRLDLQSSVGTLAGRVTHDSTGAPIERAYIEVMPLSYGSYSGDLVFTAVTDEEGKYSIDAIPAGDYAVTVFSNSGFETFENASTPWEGTPVAITKDSTSTIDFGVSAADEGPGVITGRVTGDSGEDIDLAVVVAIAMDEEKIYPAVTSANGSYEISGIPAGEYFVYAFAPRYIGEYFDDAFDPYDADLVKVTGTGATTGIDFELFADASRNLPDDENGETPQASGSVAGTVMSTTGAPIAGATVYILDDNGNPVSSARTDADGLYEIENIPGGAGYRLRATGLGYESRYNDNSATFEEATRIVVLQGRRAVDFTLQPRTSSGIRTGNSSRSGISLSGAHPNPFTSQTAITFTLPGESPVRIEVRDLLGRQVVEVFNGRLTAGRQSITWDARDRRGNLLPGGMYFYSVTSGTSVESGPVVLVR